MGGASRVREADEAGAGDDGVAGADLGDVGDRRHGASRLVGETEADRDAQLQAVRTAGDLPFGPGEVAREV